MLVNTRCPAKINLTFEILGLLPDGYHEVRTLMQAVSLEDELSFKFSRGTGLIEFNSINSPFASAFPADESNLIAKAIRRYQEKVPECKNANIKIAISKNIPIGAGVAGGSANAAAALVAANRFCGNKLTDGELQEIAATLGADVPFCLTGGTCVGTHKGDVLEKSRRTSSLSFLLVKPRELSISTPWAFKQFDELGDAKPKSDDFTASCKNVIDGSNSESIAPYLVNDLELAVFKHYPELDDVRRKLESFGALAARLTGSGPTLYALFPSDTEAESAQEEFNKYQKTLKELHPLDSWIASAVDEGARVVNSK